MKNETQPTTDEKNTDRQAEQIPEKIKATYRRAYLEFDEKERHKLIKNCERQISQLEKRIARKKNQENHQILADMKDLHRKTMQIGYTVCKRDTGLQ